MAEYFLLSSVRSADNCVISELPDSLPNRFYPIDGLRMGESWPSQASFNMSPDRLAHTVPDMIRNLLGYFMVSTEFKELLEKHTTTEIEFLPFTLLNHRGRVASDSCFVANVIGAVECVDMDKTEAEEDPVNEGRIFLIDRLYLDEDEIDPDINLFRIAPYPQFIIVRDDLKSEIEQSGIEGVEFIAMGEELD